MLCVLFMCMCVSRSHFVSRPYKRSLRFWLKVDSDAAVAMKHQKKHALPFRLLCLADAFAGRLNGPFVEWTQEERALLKYWSLPADAFSIRVLEVRKLPDERSFMFRKSEKGRQGIAKCSIGCSVFYPHWEGRCPSHVCSGTGELIRLDEDAWGAPCIVLPEPVARCALASRWSDIVLLRRWFNEGTVARLSPEWPPSDWVPPTEVARSAATVPDLTAQSLLLLASNVRLWARNLQGSAANQSDEDLEQSGQALASMGGAASTLTAWADIMSGYFDHDAGESRRGRGQRGKDALTMLRYCRLVCVIGNPANLEALLTQLVYATLPLPIAVGVVQTLGATVASRPSSSTIARHRLVYDVARVLWCQ